MKRHYFYMVALSLINFKTLPASELNTSCHIHPPEKARENNAGSPSLIGPFNQEMECERTRQDYFGALGRCHCVTGFGFPGKKKFSNVPSIGGNRILKEQTLP